MSELVLGNTNELRKGWIDSPLNHLVSMSSGTTENQFQEKTNYPVSRIETISNEFINFDKVRYLKKLSQDMIYKYQLKHGDILFSNINSDIHLGKTAIFYDDRLLIHGMNLLLIRPDERIIFPKFLNFYFKYYRNSGRFISIAQHAVNQSSINQTKLKNMDFVIPSLNEQKRIVAKIEELLSLLDSTKQLFEKTKILLKQYRQSLLNSAFGGKLTEKWRGENKPTLQKEELESWEKQRQNQYDEGCILSRNPKKPKLPEFKIIDENNIPESWICMTIESVASFVVDCPHSTPKFIEDGKYCIDTTCIEHSKIRWDDIRKVSSTEFQERILRMPIIENDIIFSREGTVGTSVLVPKDVDLCLGQRVMMFRFPPFLNPKLYELFLQSSIFIQQYLPLIGGSVAQHLNVGDIRKFKVLIPTMEEQKEIISKLELGLSLIRNTENTTNYMLKQLEKICSTILKQAFEGKLVLQDPKDEPAEILLEKIKQEKQKIISQSKRGKKNDK